MLKKVGLVVLRSVAIGAAALACLYLTLVLPRDIRRAGEYDDRCTKAMAAGQQFVERTLAERKTLPSESEFRAWADSEGLRMLNLYLPSGSSYDLMFWRGEEGVVLQGRSPAEACESWSKQSIALHWLVSGGLVALGVVVAVRWLKAWI